MAGRSVAAIDDDSVNLGPGTYNVESSIEYVKARSGSPEFTKQTIRKTQVREDAISPDQYNPNKEFIMHESPKYTIGKRYP